MSKKKKNGKLKRKFKDMQEHSTVMSSSALPLWTSKVSITKTVGNTDAPKPSDISKKAQCDLCKLSYSTQKELAEHLLSLMHHTKLEDKEKNPAHICTLCSVTCSNMIDYRGHIITDVHQRNLSRLKGSYTNNSQKDIKRGGSQRVWNDDQSSFNSGVSTTSSKPVQGHKSQNFNSQNNSNKKYQDSHSKFGARSKGSKASKGWKKKKSLLSGRSPFKNTFQYWARDKSDNEYNRHNGRKKGGKGIQETPKDNQFYNPWDSRGLNDYHDYYHSNGGFQSSSVDNYGQEDWKMNHTHFEEDYHWQEYPDYVDFATQGAWDDQLLLQHERYLAGMDDLHFSSNHRSHFEQKPADVDRWKYFSAHNRKRPRDEDVQESVHSDNLSGASVPVRGREHQERHNFQVAFETLNNSSHEPSKHPTVQPEFSSNGSYLMERAKHLCKELREKQEKPQVQLNVLEKDCEILGAEALKQKQKNQTYQKGSTKLSDSREKCSSFYSALTKKSKTSDLPDPRNAEILLSSTPQQNNSGNTLDEIRKSIETSVLERQEESQRQLKSSDVPEPKRQRRSSFCSGSAPSIESRNVTGNKPLTNVPQKLLVLKDSIKKIVNTPYSREGRLTMAKILKSRDEHKTASCKTLRRNAQIQSLQEPVEINLDAGQSGDLQTIKLEDLSDIVRHQILELIGDDVTNKLESQPEPEMSQVTSQTQQAQKAKTPQTDVIILSDTEDLSKNGDKKMKSKKKSSQKVFSVSEPEELREVTTTKKKKRKKPQITGLKESVVSCVENLTSSEVRLLEEDNELTRHVAQGTNQQEPALFADGDVEFILCSFNVNYDKSKEVCSTEETSFGSSMAACISSEAVNSSPTSITQTLPGKEVQQSLVLDANRSSQPDSTRQELSTCDNLPRIETSAAIDCIKDTTETCISDQAYQLNSDEPNQIQCGMSGPSRVEAVHQSSPLHMNTLLEPSSPITGVNSTSLQSEISSPSLQSGSQLSSQDTGPSSTLLPFQNTSISARLQMSSRLTLPPSTWLQNRTLSSINSEIQPAPTVVVSSLQQSSYQGLKVENATVVVEDEDNNTIDSLKLPDARASNIASNDKRNEFTSRIMSELLVLSEREEEVKQEKKSLDLRLSRLHKVLEHALMQINKFTEQRKQLHEEEQELSRQRFALIKATVLTPETASLDKNSKSGVVDTNPSMFTSGYTTYDKIPSSNSSQSLIQNAVPLSSTESVPCHLQGQSKTSMLSTTSLSTQNSIVTSKSGDNSQGSSLSRADWLAKFSPYLPHDPDGIGK